MSIEQRDRATVTDQVSDFKEFVDTSKTAYSNKCNGCGGGPGGHCQGACKGCKESEPLAALRASVNEKGQFNKADLGVRATISGHGKKAA